MWILSKTSLSKWIKVRNCIEHPRFQDQGQSGLKRSMKIEKFEANLILTLSHFVWIEKGSGFSQSDLIFMHLLIVSRTLERAGNPKEIDRAKSRWGRDLTDNCIPPVEKLRTNH